MRGIAEIPNGETIKRRTLVQYGDVLAVSRMHALAVKYQEGKLTLLSNSLRNFSRGGVKDHRAFHYPCHKDSHEF